MDVRRITGATGGGGGGRGGHEGGSCSSLAAIMPPYISSVRNALVSVT